MYRTLRRKGSAGLKKARVLPGWKTYEEKRKLPLRIISSLFCLILVSALLAWLLLKDQGETIPLTAWISKSSLPELGVAFISLLLTSLVWLLIELGIGTEFEVGTFTMNLSPDRLDGMKYIFGVPKMILAVVISISVLGLYWLPPNCSVPKIMFRVSENQNLSEDGFYLDGSLIDVQPNQALLVSAIDIQDYLSSKDVSIREELECVFDGLGSSETWQSCYTDFDIQAEPKVLSGKVRVENCAYISTFKLTFNPK
jgi:hypothetical protein